MTLRAPAPIAGHGRLRAFGLPIYEWTIVACAICAAPAIIRQLNPPDRLKRDPVTICVLGVFLALAMLGCGSLEMLIPFFGIFVGLGPDAGQHGHELLPGDGVAHGKERTEHDVVGMAGVVRCAVGVGAVG